MPIFLVPVAIWPTFVKKIETYNLSAKNAGLAEREVQREVGVGADRADRVITGRGRSRWYVPGSAFFDPN